MDPDRMGLVAIKTLPGPLYEPEQPLSGFANNKYRECDYDSDSSFASLGQNAPTGLTTGRPRSHTLPNPKTGGTSSHGKSSTSSLPRSRRNDSDARDLAPAQPPTEHSKNDHLITDSHSTVSEGEGLGRRRQAQSSQHKGQQTGGLHMHSRIGRAQAHPGSNPHTSERQLVEGFRSPGGWQTRVSKRSVSCVLSPKSIQEQEPEKKRRRDPKASLRTEVDKHEVTQGSDRVTSSHGPQSAMLEHIINIANRSGDMSVAAASNAKKQVADEGQTSEAYAESVEDHVKTDHREMGPMKKQRMRGLAKLGVQRKMKQEQHGDDSPALSGAAAMRKRARISPKL
ncbi:hypothetical protein BDP81DRAFT_407915 [Colletotrichum phormii]|uniref:Uncharacterized protein n=1 Tax=Colletotrichum phormii TaxID=359342 RepID=A0AAI9ZN66_9PEZI|nr:uncharacterized protein BDP81DRAFT_407915 [Colletotrichum phormii]KAK1634755.1 hypothetical protein BDP81DRAFT_407915 [Colletotrichum phormii]